MTMPRYICKLTDSKTNVDYYFEWSTIVDAPVTYGMSLKEFKEYYKSQYGKKGMEDLPDRLERVEQKGTSSQIDDSVTDLLCCNRAGEGEKELTIKEILNQYCINVKTK